MSSIDMSSDGGAIRASQVQPRKSSGEVELDALVRDRAIIEARRAADERRQTEQDKSFKIPAYHVSNLHYPLLYTFGIEFEFLIMYDEERMGPQPSTGSWEPAAKYLAKHFQAKGLKVTGIEYDSYEPFTAWRFDTDASILSRPEHGTGPKKRAIEFEIASPILQFDQAGFDEVETALKILKEEVDCDVNKTCGLHIHVGSRCLSDADATTSTRSRGLPLQSLRNFLSLTTLFEEQINTIHPLCRTTRNSCYSGWCRPPSWLTRALPFEEIPQFFEKDDDFASLYNRMSHIDYDYTFGKPAYKIGYLRDENEEGLRNPDFNCRTIEYRQHRATLNWTKVKPWLKLVVRMLQFSHECGPKGLPVSLLCRAGDADFSLRDFLIAIGADPKVVRYYWDVDRRKEQIDLVGLHEDAEEPRGNWKGRATSPVLGFEGEVKRAKREPKYSWDLTNRKGVSY